MAIALTDKVGDLVAERFDRIRVFEKFGIDYCCGGGRTLAEACGSADCDPRAVADAVEAADRDSGTAPATTDWRAAPLADLADHIEATHHQFMKRELPRLHGLMRKVVEAHGTNHPELHDAERILSGLRAEIELHLAKEEQVLFPLIREMEATGTAGEAHCGTVNNPIGVMEREHDNAGAALRELRRLTGGYETPEDGCLTYRALMEGLAAMEKDLHAHIHMENNILHPRAVELEASLLRRARA